MPPTTTTQDLCPPCLSPQYYDGTFPTAKEQAAFERNIFSKTHQMGGELGGGGGVSHMGVFAITGGTRLQKV